MKNKFIAGTTSLPSGEKEVQRRIKHMAYFKKPRIIWIIIMTAAAIAISGLCLTNSFDGSSVSDEKYAESAESKEDKIRGAIPDGSEIAVNSGMGWSFKLFYSREFEKMVGSSLNIDFSIEEYADKIGLKLSDYIDKELNAVIYDIILPDESLQPYLFIFDNADNLIASRNLENGENEETAKRIFIMLEENLPYFKESSSEDTLYDRTKRYLEQEFYRVYSPYYEILGLDITNWDENGNEATFFYTMTHKNFDKDPDTVEFIIKAKESGDKNYEKYKEEYLKPQASNFEFKVVSDGENLKLYYNAAPKGQDWQPIKIDDFIMH